MSGDSDLASPDAPPTGPDGELAHAGMTPEQLAEARRYGRLAFYCDLADKATDVIFLGCMAFFVARPLDDWLKGYALTPTVRVACMFLITLALHLAVSFPLSMYSGYLLEHRFGLSQQSFARWLGRYAKRNALAAAFGALLFVGLFWIVWLSGPHWWIVAAGAFFIVSIIFGQLMPVLILPLFYKIEPLDDPELTRRMGRLAEGTGLSIEGVYRMGLSIETSKANAMLAGLGRTRRVMMGDTLLDSFSPDEIEVILAHEIGHHVFRHIRKMIAVGLLVSAAGFWLCDYLVMAWARHFDPEVIHADLPISALPLLMFILTLFALLLEPLQNIISRHYERQCDRYALERTGLRQAYTSAFRKLARLNKDDPDPHPVEVFLFHSHPPISQRLAMAED